MDIVVSVFSFCGVFFGGGVEGFGIKSVITYLLM